MMHDINARKTLRARLQLLRNATDEKYRQDSCIKLIKKFRSLLTNFEPGALKIISGFYPIKSEINILPLLSYAQSQGFEIALPYINRENVMQFITWSLNAPVKLHPKFGFPEPKNLSNPVIPDIALVPLLGFDKYGNRIGYGMGYYDKTIKSLSSKKIISVGCAFSIQEVIKIERAENDMKLDFIITEKEVIECIK